MGAPSQGWSLVVVSETVIEAHWRLEKIHGIPQSQS